MEPGHGDLEVDLHQRIAFGDVPDSDDGWVAQVVFLLRVLGHRLQGGVRGPHSHRGQRLLVLAQSCCRNLKQLKNIIQFNYGRGIRYMSVIPKDDWFKFMYILDGKKCVECLGTISKFESALIVICAI